MRRFVLAMACGCGMAMAGEDLVDVRAVDQTVLEQIAETDKAIEKAAAAVAEAKVTLDLVKSRRDELSQRELGKVETYEQTCPVAGSMMTTEVKYRRFRRAELRGRYVLVMEGSEQCSGDNWHILNNALTVGGSLTEKEKTR